MRAGALPEPSPAHPSPAGEEVSNGNVDDRAARVARLELVRPGIHTAATLAHERTLPVVKGLRELTPSGVLQRGSTLAVHGLGATSFALGVVAEAVRSGSFLAVVAPASFNLAACLDFDIPLRRVVQFVLPTDTGQGRRGGWPQQVAAVIEGFDLVILADRHRARPSQARQLVARTRERGSVVVRTGGASWSDAPDLRFDLSQPVWHGLGRGHGHLTSRIVRVQVAGRRWPGAPRARHLQFSETGIEPVDPQLEPRQLEPVERFAGSDIDALVEAELEEGAPGVPASHPTPTFGTVA